MKLILEDETEILYFLDNWKKVIERLEKLENKQELIDKHLKKKKPCKKE